MSLMKSAVEKFKKDGAIEFFRETGSFVFSRTVPKPHRFRYRTFKNYYVNEYKYSEPAKPYRTIWVDPTEITYRSTRITVGDGLGQIREGKWDKEQNLDQIDNHLYVRGLYERYIQDKKWEDTTYVAYAEEKIAENGERWGCETVEEFIKSRCAYVDELYHSINTEGYKPEMNSNSNKKYQGRRIYKQNLEPLVLIGRDGRIIWRDGYHRYAIANILDLSIPVNVLCRHQDWQLFRDEMSSTKQSVDNTHPDLQDVI